MALPRADCRLGNDPDRIAARYADASEINRQEYDNIRRQLDRAMTPTNHNTREGTYRHDNN